ncbi:MAG: hypothetical protein HYX29_04305 [Solirubrobacterales bacterium]|nr:hypothetical protein [Solirubrobacterales bacterium]
MSDSNELVVVQVAPNQAAVELPLSVLRSEGIKCISRASSRAAGIGDGISNWGPQEVLVHPRDAEAARELLREPEAGS